MDWSWCNIRGEVSDIPTNFQKDIVGNIVQKRGGVKPKACQICKKEFKKEIEIKPVVEKVPMYECSCTWKNASGEAAFDHYLTNKDHKLTKTTKERVVRKEKTIKGDTPVIKILDKEENLDYKILCNNCGEE